MDKPPKVTKCPWCGRERVAITPKRALAPHLTPGSLRCAGIGIDLTGLLPDLDSTQKTTRHRHRHARGR